MKKTMTFISRAAGTPAHTVRRAATVLLKMMLTTMTAWAWEGDGSKDNPYQISRTDARS